MKKTIFIPKKVTHFYIEIDKKKLWNFIAVFESGNKRLMYDKLGYEDAMKMLTLATLKLSEKGK